ncbi:MAG: efflux RND transporter periplasmic adaptor subunit [Acidobacteriaceae bacterium]
MKVGWSLRAAMGCGVALMVSAGLCGCDSRPGPEATAEAQRLEAAPKPAVVKTVAATAVRSFRTTGPLVADQQADIAAQRDGRVVEILVDIGDRVQRGQVMAVLDDRALKDSCAEQKAKVASLQAQVKEWQSEALVEGADLRRADALRADRILSDEDWEHVKYKLDEVKAEVTRYQADEQAAEAALQEANLQLEQSRIVAPFAGVVGRRSLRMAQEVKTGDVLFWITAVAPLHVLFTVPEQEMEAYRRGAALELTTQDYPELRQRARVYKVSPVVDPASGSVQVIGEVVGPSPLLKPGMTMQVRAAAR